MEKLDAQIEIWKKVVDVQQHFNDLELRVRNFALLVTGAFLGLGGYAIKDGGLASICGYQVSSAAVVVGASLIPLLAFYVMDRLWYHRLLDGAVKAGVNAEKVLSDLGLDVDLGEKIKVSSPFTVPWLNIKFHSRHKMDAFYGLLALAIIVVTFALTTGGIRSGRPAEGRAGAAHLSESGDDMAAKAICQAYVDSLVSASNNKPGSIVSDPTSGSQAIFVAGRWMLLPKC